ncbi:MAG TPA: hypothetical protein VLM78_01665, partial [Anaerolineales bacterium]|nr:hypothetical protein [Anaerolineales bacterium]
MKKVLPLILGLTVLLSACGAKAPPTIDAASVNATAVAMAFTMAAQTQAALPTATATLPPTETPTLPLPSPTFFTFPTLEATATATASGDGPCYHVMMPDPPGKKFIARIWNTNKAPVTGNVCLYKDTGQGVTGIIGISLGKNADIILNLPFGCYSAFFWVNDTKKPSQASGSALCANNADKWTFKIGA